MLIFRRGGEQQHRIEKGLTTVRGSIFTRGSGIVLREASKANVNEGQAAGKEGQRSKRGKVWGGMRKLLASTEKGRAVDADWREAELCRQFCVDERKKAK